MFSYREADAAEHGRARVSMHCPVAAISINFRLCLQSATPGLAMSCGELAEHATSSECHLSGFFWPWDKRVACTSISKLQMKAGMTPIREFTKSISREMHA